MNYTAYGLRVSKTVGNSSTSHYIYNGTTLVQEKTVTSSGTKYITFLYNGEGLTGFVYDNTLYTYRKNLFGDIIAVYQGRTKVAEYAYDAYGKCTIILNTAGIATTNPFRYRSYYFDSETGLFLVSSRYYDPETGRFISPDDISYLDPETIGGLNLYAYCLNNPVMYVDPTGHFPVLALILGITALAGLGLTIGGVATGNNTLTAVGLTMVAIPALISGGMAIAAGMMVLILLSSFIQTMYFKASRKITGTGKRVFLRAPLHHHFEELGWPETKIVERFFIMSILFSGLALILLKFA